MRNNILRRIIAAVLVCTLLTGQFLISGAYAEDNPLFFDGQGNSVDATEDLSTSDDQSTNNNPIKDDETTDGDQAADKEQNTGGNQSTDGDQTTGSDQTSAGDQTSGDDQTSGGDQTNSGDQTSAGDQTSGDDQTSGGDQTNSSDQTTGGDQASGDDQTSDGDQTNSSDQTTGGNQASGDDQTSDGNQTNGGDQTTGGDQISSEGIEDEEQEETDVVFSMTFSGVLSDSVAQNDPDFTLTVTGTEGELENGQEITVNVSIVDNNIEAAPNLQLNSTVTISLPAFFEFTDADREKLQNGYGKYFGGITHSQNDNKLILTVKENSEGTNWADMQFTVTGAVNTEGYEGDGQGQVIVTVGNTGATTAGTQLGNRLMLMGNGMAMFGAMPADAETKPLIVSFVTTQTGPLSDGDDFVFTIRIEDPDTIASPQINNHVETITLPSYLTALNIYTMLGNSSYDNIDPDKCSYTGNTLTLYFKEKVTNDSNREVTLTMKVDLSQYNPNDPNNSIIAGNQSITPEINTGNTQPGDGEGIPGYKDGDPVKYLSKNAWLNTTNGAIKDLSKAIGYTLNTKINTEAVFPIYLTDDLAGGALCLCDAAGNIAPKEAALSSYIKVTVGDSAEDSAALGTVSIEESGSGFKITFPGATPGTEKKDIPVVVNYYAKVSETADSAIINNTAAIKNGTTDIGSSTQDLMRSKESSLHFEKQIVGGETNKVIKINENTQEITFKLLMTQLGVNQVPYKTGDEITFDNLHESLTYLSGQTVVLTGPDSSKDYSGYFTINVEGQEVKFVKNNDLTFDTGVYEIYFTVTVDTSKIQEGQVVTNTISNSTVYLCRDAGLTVTKYWDGDENKIGGGAKFGLYASETGDDLIYQNPDAVKGSNTNNSCEFTFSAKSASTFSVNGQDNLASGTYYLRETLESDCDYAIHQAIPITINVSNYAVTVTGSGVTKNDNGHASLTITNRPETGKGEITFTKYGENNRVLTGGKYELWRTYEDGNAECVEEDVTIVNNSVTFKDLDYKPLNSEQYYQYYIKEIEAPAGNTLNTENNANISATETISKDDRFGQLSLVNTPYQNGSITIIKNDGTTALPGAQFKLYSYDGIIDDQDTLERTSGETGDDGTVIFNNLSVGKYYIMESQAPQHYGGFTGPVIVEIRADNDGVQHPVSISVNNSTQGTSTYDPGTSFNINWQNDKKCSIKIIKQDASTDAIMPNVLFGLYSDAGCSELKNSGTTSEENGLVYFGNLDPGTYYIKERSTPNGYKPLEEPISVTVSTDGTGEQHKTVTVENERYQYAVKFRKTDEYGKPLQDVRFKLNSVYRDGRYQTVDGIEVKMTSYSDANGMVTFTNLPYGTYTIEEMDAMHDSQSTVETMSSRGYILLSPFEVTIPVADGIIDENAEVPTIDRGTKVNRHTKLTVLKQDRENENEPLEGAKFILKKGNQFVKATLQDGIYHYVGTVADQTSATIFTTGTDGTFILYYIPEGDYQLIEEEAPGGYWKLDAPISVNISGEYNNLSVDNDLIQKNLVITKKDSNGKLLENIGFKLRTIRGWVKATETEGEYIFVEFVKNRADATQMVTNAEGKLKVNGLLAGDYDIYETQSRKGLVRPSERVATITVDGNKDQLEITKNITNEILKQSIRFTKVDSLGEGVQGAVFQLKLVEDLGNSYALEEEAVHYAISGADGTVEFEPVPYGIYELTEYQPAHGYEPSDKVYHICVGIDTTTVTGNYENLYSADGFNYEQIRWPNEKSYYALVIFKENIPPQGSEPVRLNGATFEISGITVDDFHTTATIEENGYVIVEVPALGEYKVTEISPPEGYTIDPEPMTVQVTKHIPKKEIEYAIQNNTLYNTARVTSRDAETVVKLQKVDETENILAGARFQILLNEKPLTFTGSEGTYVYAPDSDTGTTNLVTVKGELTIRKLPLGTYTVREVMVPDGYMNLGDVTLVVDETGTNENTLTIKNIPHQKGVAVCKEDQNGNRLSGALFELYDSNGKILAKKTTTASGYAVFEPLKMGRYFLKESNSPAGYQSNSTEYWFEIDASGNLNAIDSSGNPTDAYSFENRGTEAQPFYILKVVNTPEQYKLRLKKVSTTSEEIVLPGAQFRILGNGINQTYTTNDDGYVDISLPVGEYMLTEIEAPHGYVMDPGSHAIKVTPTGITVDTDQVLQLDQQTHTYSFTVKNEPEEFRLAIRKVDADTGEGLAGAVFTVTSQKDGSVKYRMGTDAKGVSDSVSLKPGTYGITEIDAPNGYTIPMSGWQIKVKEGGMGNVTLEGDGIEKHSYEDGLLTLSITNQRTSGNLTINKHDAQDKTIVLKGARFRLIDVGSNAVWMTGADGKYEVVRAGTPGADNSFRTGSDGKAIVENLPFGEYKLYELNAPVGYQVMSEPFVIVKMTKQDESLQINVPNEQLQRKVTVVKEDEGGMKLTGAVFTLYGVDTDGSLKVIGEDTTGTDGIAEFTVPYGSYEIWETQAPSGYERCETPIRFTYNAETPEDENFTYTVENLKSKYSIQVYKYQDGEPDRGLNGAEFAVTNSLGFTKVITTDEQGIAKLENAQYDDYTIREITAPDGYYLHDHEYEVKRTDLKHGEPVEIKVPNEPILGSIWLRKLDYQDHDQILNAEFVIYDEKDNPLTWTETETGYVLDPNGSERIHAGNVKLENIPGGKYRLEEVKAPDGYLVLENDYEFSISAENAKAEVVHEIMNLKRISAFGVCKVDADDNSIRLAGAEFTLYAMDNGVQGEAIETLVTGSNGWAIFTELTMGTYRIVETKTPFGYEKTSDSIVNFRITGDGDIEVFYNNEWTPVPEGARTIGVRNKSIVQKITLKKVAEDTHKPLEGAVFQLMGKDVSVRLVTNKDGIAEATLPYGEYLLKEIVAPDGYLLDRNPHRLQISETELKVDSKSVKGFTFVLDNHPVKIPVILHKEDAESGESLSGAEFTISGNCVKSTVTSGRKGNTEMIYLTPGRYTVSETVTPDGYRKPVYGWTLTVDNHGSVHVSGSHSVVALVDHVPTVTIGNEKVSVSSSSGSSSGGGGGSSIAKTGEVINRNMLWAGVLMSSVSSVGLAALFLDEMRRRRRVI